MYADKGDEVSRKLVKSQPRINVKKWGEIKNDRAIVRATCRRCGTYGQFENKQDERVFADFHNGKETGGKCPLERDMQY